MAITGVQIRMARAALGITTRILSDKTGVTKDTISRIENGGNAYKSTMISLQTTLERLGIEFIPENGGGVGVRLPKDISKNEGE